MRKFINSTIIGLVASLLMLVPADEVGQHVPSALAISGATLPFPGNGDFEAPQVFVGNGPTNYDFSGGGTGWSKIGNVTYTGGVAKLVDAGLRILRQRLD